MRVTDRQVRKLFMEYQKSGKIQMAALKAGMNRDTASAYIGSGRLPSEQVVARDWRTRQDPFEAHWAEAEAMLREAPELEAKALFEWLGEQHGGQYDEGQLRTFQRHVRRWRALPDGKTLATLDQERFPLRVRRQLAALLEGRFVEQADNVLAFGLPGRGKTHLCCAIVRELVIAKGYRALFCPALHLVQQLLVAKRDLRLEAALRMAWTAIDAGIAPHEEATLLASDAALAKEGKP